MPECAEVKLNVDFLESVFKNQEIINILVSPQYIDGNKSIKELNNFQRKINHILPVYFRNIKSKGKFIYGEVFHGDAHILYFYCSLGMTGFWTNKNIKHNQISFHLDNGQLISFNDARKFGYFHFTSLFTPIQEKLNVLGVDFLGTNQEWKDQVVSSLITTRIKNISNKKQVCEVLLDQSIFCGVGNYLKSEILYACNIHPASLWSKLSETQIWNLFTYARIIIRKAYKANGASFKSFKDSSGQRTGTFSDEFQVYGRKETPEGDKVTRMIFKDKRSSWYSEKEQKLFK